MTEFTFRLEMASGQRQREIPADGFFVQPPWLVFNTVGREYWRVNLAHVVSMETVRNSKRGGVS